MTQRYYTNTRIDGETFTLTGDEAHHAARVMRVRAGDQVVLFDGFGAEYLARVDEVSKRQTRLTILERNEIDRELPFTLTLAVSLPKGDRQKWLVEKLTELGATELVPLVTERSVAQPVDKAIDRLRRAVIEASKQCERNRLMTVAEPVEFEPFIGERVDAHRLIAHPGGDSLNCALATPNNVPLENVVAMVGPEGGFAEVEVRAAQDAGWQSVGLGPAIMRVETAAIALGAAIAIDHGDRSNGSP